MRLGGPGILLLSLYIALWQSGPPVSLASIHGVGKLVLCGRVSQRMHECLI